MKFIIRRTSDWYGDKQPCSNAIEVTKPPQRKQKVEGTVQAMFEDAETKARRESEEWWRKNEPIPKEWEIEINSLEELIELVNEVTLKRHTEGIIISPNPKDKTYEIEIYDGYRE